MEEEKAIDNPTKKDYNISILSRRCLRRTILQLCAKLRPQFNRVSPEFVDEFLQEQEEEIIIRIKEKIIFSDVKARTLK